MRRVAIIVTLLCLKCCLPATAQPPQFSVSTDINLQRSFKHDQRYWAVGHTIQGHFHITSKDGIYIWGSYYSKGRFHNRVTATAKSPSTTPQVVVYDNNSLMRFKHLSAGWKRYLKGKYNEERRWNIYAYAGFGLLFGHVENTHSVSIDTTVYNVPVRSGIGKFKRLTFDVGLGNEIPLGADIFLYTEARLWIPTTEYPSKFIFMNDNAPLIGMANAGIRILF